VDTLRQILFFLGGLLQTPLFRLGGAQVTTASLLAIILLILALIYFTAWVQRWLVNRLLARSNLEVGTRAALGGIVRYALLAVGLLIILQTAGIDLTALNVLAGTLGIGLGLGLQDILNNFISGVIILFERPVKVGDRIDVGNVQGQVIRIGARSTTVLTNDNIAIIVPNQDFMTEEVINWSYTDNRVRFSFPVSVAYGSDVRLVERLLLEVAQANPEVLEDPEPMVYFLQFGDSGLEFELRAWTESRIHRRDLLTSDLNFAIYDAFNAHQIEIPFPQRDIHIRSGSLEWKPPEE
jgi:small-conductance mechanosensitive channel